MYWCERNARELSTSRAGSRPCGRRRTGESFCGRVSRDLAAFRSANDKSYVEGNLRRSKGLVDPVEESENSQYKDDVYCFRDYPHLPKTAIQRSAIKTPAKDVADATRS